MLVLVVLIYFWLVIIGYIMSFAKRYISNEANEQIDAGLNIIDQIFILDALTAIAGFYSYS